MTPEQVELAWGRASKIIRERDGYRHCYGSGCDKLLEYLAKKMPSHSFFYDENTISDLPQSILASEITREKLFKNLNQELPYNLTVETEKWEEKPDKSVRI